MRRKALPLFWTDDDGWLSLYRVSNNVGSVNHFRGRANADCHASTALFGTPRPSHGGLKVEPELSRQRARRHIVRPAEGRKEVI
jgi:hypothetical protein